MEGRSILRLKVTQALYSQFRKDRQKFESDNAHRIAMNINPRTYKIFKERKECRTDVIDKIKSHLNKN